VDTLKKEFPQVWFESCSSGGGRIDLGMMSRMDLTWISDNTYALNRLFIQYGYLSAMPANTMISFVVDKIGSLYRLPTSLDFRFDVAMSGVLGISDNILDWSAADLSLAQKKILLYKKIRPLIQQGTLYRLVSPFKTNREALQYVSPDSTSAVLMAYNMAVYLSGSQLKGRESDVLRLKGLKLKARYRVERADVAGDNGAVYPGGVLMNIGIPWPVQGDYSAAIIRITQEGNREEHP
jgi:alpha-galactosidase